MPDFLPRRDADLLAWTANFVGHVGEVLDACGLPTGMADGVGASHLAFADAYAAANAPATRSVLTIQQKEACRAELLRQVRALAGQLRTDPSTTAAHHASLGTRPPRKRNGRIIPPPTTAPGLSVQARHGQDVTVRRFEAGTGRRKRPHQAANTAFYTFVGEHCPAELSEWRYVGSVTTETVTLSFDPTLPPGTRMWTMARWVSPTGKPGPLCRPIFTFLAGGEITMPVRGQAGLGPVPQAAGGEGEYAHS